VTEVDKVNVTIAKGHILKKVHVNRLNSTTAILYGNFNAGNVTTQMKGDLISQVPLQYDCCEELGIHVNLSKMTMDLAYKRTVSHLDNMKYASKKVSDLFEEVREQEMRNEHVIYHDTLFYCR
jgi:hypothetical protein